MNELFAVDPPILDGSTVRLLCISFNWSGSTAKFRVSAQAISVEHSAMFRYILYKSAELPYVGASSSKAARHRVVLQQESVGIDAVRAKRSRYLPTVLTPDEVQWVISHLYGVYKLVIQLLYGSGLR